MRIKEFQLSSPFLKDLRFPHLSWGCDGQRRFIYGPRQKRILDDTLPNASQKRLQEKKMSIRTKLVWPKQTSCSWFCTNKIAESQIDESTPMPIELTTSVTRCLQRRLHICDQWKRSTTVMRSSTRTKITNKTNYSYLKNVNQQYHRRIVKLNYDAKRFVRYVNYCRRNNVLRHGKHTPINNARQFAA